jgi:hypothetical protein
MNKECNKCKEAKPISEFYYNRQRKKYMNSCKSCNSKTCGEYQKNSKYKDTENYVFYQRAYEIKRRCLSKGIVVMEGLQEHLTRLWNQSKKCAYSGREMAINGYQNNPYAMTVDRKDPRLGYIEGNITLCCSLANRMKQNLNEKELVEWCNTILDHLSQK